MFAGADFRQGLVQACTAVLEDEPGYEASAMEPALAVISGGTAFNSIADVRRN